MPAKSEKRSYGWGRTVDCKIKPEHFYRVLSKKRSALAIKMANTVDEAIRWNV